MTTPKMQEFGNFPLFMVDKAELARLQGVMLFNLMMFKSTCLPLANELAELNKIGFSTPPEALLGDWVERQKSALNFQKFVPTFGKQLFGSATYEGETLLAENELFKLNHIPVKKGLEKKASLFHLGGFVPYSDNLFRLLPEANFFDRFIENGIDVYEMKCKCATDQFNAHLLDLSIEKIIDTAHTFSDIAYAHAGKKKMILEGYCGTGIHTYTSMIADIENMSKKFNLILTFVSPVDGRKCQIFEEMHKALRYLNPQESNVDGFTISTVLDTVQERNFEKTPFGALVHGWKNKEYGKVNKIEDLTPRQRSELAAWYWLSLQHGSYYPLSQDLYVFYSTLFANGISKAGIIPYTYKGKVLDINALKKTKIKVLAFLGDKDNLVVPNTADILVEVLGQQCEVIVHEKTGHVAYIFNPQRWRRDDKRAFQPDIIDTILDRSGNSPSAATSGKSRQKKGL